MFTVSKIRFEPNKAELARLRQSPGSDVGWYLYERGQKLRTLAMGSVGVDTGQLRLSIKVKQGKYRRDQKVTIGSSKKYALMHHQGTRPHTIRPKIKKALHFKVGGVSVFAQEVNHPGTKKNEFLSKHLATVIR